LIPALQEAGIEPILVNAREMGQACGAFYDAAVNDRIRYVNHPDLNAALAGAKKRDLGDAWAWHRKDSVTDISPLYVAGAYKANGPVFATILARQLVFSEARFQWRTFSNGRPGPLFGSPALSLLEKPWPNGTTGELLSRMEQDASLAGNAYETLADDLGNLGRSATGPGRRIVRIRPDWVQIVIGSFSGDPFDLDAKPLGYLYRPATAVVGRPDTWGGEVLLLPSEVAHYSPIPDPIARFRGMSWLTPVLNEITSDKAATTHKRSSSRTAPRCRPW
jgi:hypothetical protein